MAVTPSSVVQAGIKLAIRNGDGRRVHRLVLCDRHRANVLADLHALKVRRSADILLGGKQHDIAAVERAHHLNALGLKILEKL